MKKISSITRVVLASLFVVVIVRSGLGVVAQSEEEVWQTPLNLSHSGVAAEPVFAVGPDGVYHAFWQDAFSGFVYASGSSGGWNPPLPVRLPFSEPTLTVPSTFGFGGLYKPLLVVDPGNTIHGFWIDGEGALLYSRAAIAELASPSAWASSMQLADSATARHVVVSPGGRLHLSYVRPADTDGAPAGIYYRQSVDGGEAWSEPIALSFSPYLRSLTENQLNVQIAVAAGQPAAEAEGAAHPERLHVVWDDPLIDTVFESHSFDGGASWTAPLAVDSRMPDDVADATGPGRIRVITKAENEVHLAWWAGHGEDSLTCTLYHQQSQDGGETWQPRQAVFEDTQTCAIDNHFIVNSENTLYLLFAVRGEVHLQVWDGERWSEAESQPALVSFTNPETFRTVTLGCLQPVATAENDLLVIGCGTSGESSEVWALRRPLGNLADWSTRFRPTPVWSQPVDIVNSAAGLFTPKLVAGTDGRLHAFWSQSNGPGDIGRAEEAGDSIYYSRLDTNGWLPSRSILSLPTGNVDYLAVTADAAGSLYVAWSGGELGEIYFSRALAERAVSVAEWFEPRVLPVTWPIGWPDIAVDTAGTIYIAYAVPLNEGRSIYLTRSADGGATWTEPVKVFDAVAADWQMVGAPQLVLTGTDALHLLWTRRSLSTTLSLVYARSEDGGQSWSEPEVVVQGAIEQSEIMGVGERMLHRTWLENEESRATLWHQYSLDNGLTWSRPARIADPAARSGPGTLVLDVADNPHLLQLLKNNANQLTLQEWRWSGERWQPDDSVTLSDIAADVNGLSAAPGADGSLNLVYGSFWVNLEDGQVQESLSYSSRFIELPAETATPLPPLTPTPIPLATSTPVPEPTATPPLTFAATDEDSSGVQDGPPDSNSLVDRLLIGVIPAFLIVIAVFVVGMRFARMK